MTPQEEHWRQTFLDAYKNNTGDARRLALNEAWYNFVRSEDYHNLNLTEIQGFAHGHYSYWTALVDAAHVEQEPIVRPWVSASFPKEESDQGIVIGGGGTGQIEAKSLQDLLMAGVTTRARAEAAESILEWVERYHDKGEATLYVVTDEAEVRALTERIGPKKDDGTEDS